MSAPRFIYHIVSNTEWEKYAGEEAYFPPGLYEEGFIHCSRAEQVNATLERFYKAKKDIRILKIDSTLLNVPLIYEAARNGAGFFPHVFGGIGKYAIVEELLPPFNFP